jgi:hypothetical protein
MKKASPSSTPRRPVIGPNAIFNKESQRSTRLPRPTIAQKPNAAGAINAETAKRRSPEIARKTTKQIRESRIKEAA